MKPSLRARASSRFSGISPVTRRNVDPQERDEQERDRKPLLTYLAILRMFEPSVGSPGESRP
jgi:hypothetical protein